MNEKTKKMYEAPRLTVMQCRVERGFIGSTLTSVFALSTWINTGGGAWSGNEPESVNSFGGWTDNGGSAWD